MKVRGGGSGWWRPGSQSVRALHHECGREGLSAKVGNQQVLQEQRGSVPFQSLWQTNKSEVAVAESIFHFVLFTQDDIQLVLELFGGDL